MSSPGPLMEFLGRLAFEWTKLQPFIPTYLHLLASAVFPIFAGAHASLSRPSSAAEPRKRKNSLKDGDDDSEDEVVVQKMEGLSPSDALMFPLLAGVTLTTLYFIIKWLKDPAILNRILGYYFTQIGMFFGIKFTKDLLTVVRSFVLPNQYSTKISIVKIDGKSRQHLLDSSSVDGETKTKRSTTPFPSYFAALPLPTLMKSSLWTFRNAIYRKATIHFRIYKLVTLKAPIDLLDIAATLVSATVVIYTTFVTKPWYLTNFLGFSFCYGSLQFMSPTTFWTGTLLLCSLFIYDIYFVFFTPMMVTVATKLDVPIKLLFPRPADPERDPSVKALAMLGLGDIVIPGMMIALALRFDLYLFYLRKQTSQPAVTGIADSTEPKTVNSPLDPIKAKYVTVTGGWGERFWTKGTSITPKEMEAKNFPKTYFYAGIVGYVIGMVATLGVMQIAEHAQPALLYLVPGVLGSLWGTAAVKGDFKKMWEFTEASDDEDETKKQSPNEVANTKGNDTRNEETHHPAENSSTIEASSSSANPADVTKPTSPAENAEKPKTTTDSSHLHLVYFSIDLPNPSTAAVEPEKASISTPSISPAITSATKNSSSPLGSLNGTFDVIDRVSEDSANGVEPGHSGERPEKRRRRV